METIKKNIKYIHKKNKDKEVNVVGRVLLLPDKEPLIVYTNLRTGEAQAARENVFLDVYQAAYTD